MHHLHTVSSVSSTLTTTTISNSMKYKTLITSGCSFTANYSWATALAKELGLKLVNLAVPGAGNQHIANSIILYLERNNVDIDTTLIGVMWSGLNRTDLLVNLPVKPHRYSYDDKNKLVLLAQLLDEHKITNEMLSIERVINLIDIIFQPGEYATATNSWLAMNHLNSYLSSKSYNYFQTTFYDYTTDPAPDFPIGGINYLRVLPSVNLSYNFLNQINFPHQNFLGNYALTNNLLCTDNIHPSNRCHELWTKDILIPSLVSCNII